MRWSDGLGYCIHLDFRCFDLSFRRSLSLKCETFVVYIKDHENLSIISSMNGSSSQYVTSSWYNNSFRLYQWQVRFHALNPNVTRSPYHLYSSDLAVVASSKINMSSFATKIMALKRQSIPSHSLCCGNVNGRCKFTSPDELSLSGTCRSQNTICKFAQNEVNIT